MQSQTHHSALRCGEIPGDSVFAITDDRTVNHETARNMVLEIYSHFGVYSLADG